MKEFKKNNKGFSLVELIVVVLIMAIIAVALAPQVLKWVNNSRISADQNTMQQVVANFQTALTNEAVYKQVQSISGTDATVLVIKNNDGTNNTAWSAIGSGYSDSNDPLRGKFAEYSGLADDKTKIQNEFKTKVTGNEITIKITNKGKVEGSMKNSVESIDN